jgi:hypothetical protein
MHDPRTKSPALTSLHEAAQTVDDGIDLGRNLRPQVGWFHHA